MRNTVFIIIIVCCMSIFDLAARGGDKKSELLLGTTDRQAFVADYYLKSGKFSTTEKSWLRVLFRFLYNFNYNSVDGKSGGRDWSGYREFGRHHSNPKFKKFVGEETLANLKALNLIYEKLDKKYNFDHTLNQMNEGKLKSFTMSHEDSMEYFNAQEPLVTRLVRQFEVEESVADSSEGH